MIVAAIQVLAALAVAQAPSGNTSLADRVSARTTEVSSKLQSEYEATLQLHPDRTRFENAFQLDTESYTVRCNDSYAVARLIGDVLEKMRPEYHRLLDAEPARGDRMKVFVFRSIDEYNQFGTNNGAQHSSNYGGFYSTQNAERPIATYVSPSSESPQYTRMWATHAAFHQYLAAVSPTALPTWLDEGLASYFELYLIPNAWTGYIPALGDKWQPHGLPVSLSKLLRDGVEAYTPDHYTEIGAFLYYLRHLRADTSAVFDEYIRKTLRGDVVSDSPVTRLVSGDLAALEKEFIAALQASKR